MCGARRFENASVQVTLADRWSDVSVNIPLQTTLHGLLLWGEHPTSPSPVVRTTCARAMGWHLRGMPAAAASLVIDRAVVVRGMVLGHEFERGTEPPARAATLSPSASKLGRGLPSSGTRRRWRPDSGRHRHLAGACATTARSGCDETSITISARGDRPWSSIDTISSTALPATGGITTVAARSPAFTRR